MNENICISKNYFFILIIVFILLIYIYYSLFNFQINKIKNEYSDNKLPVQQLYKNIINYNEDKLPVQHLYKNINQDDEIIYRKNLENRDRSIISDPIIAPERRVDIIQYPRTNEINIPTRGYPDNYQMLGIATRENDEKIIQLFGRATFPGSNQYEYYVTTSEFGFQNKIPVHIHGSKEIMNNDIIHIPELNKGEFKIKLYNYNTPRYNPYIF